MAEIETLKMYLVRHEDEVDQARAELFSRQVEFETLRTKSAAN